MEIRIEKTRPSEYKLIKQLFVSAFPRVERPPFRVLKKTYEKGKADMFSVYADGRFAGFCHALVGGGLVYFFYFAIKDEFRGMGVGSSVLRLVTERYDGRKLFLAIETPDENAPNYGERVRRHGFYEKNGLHDLPHFITEAGETYAVMGTGDAVSPEEYRSLVADSFGVFWSSLHGMRMTDQKK